MMIFELFIEHADYIIPIIGFIAQQCLAGKLRWRRIGFLLQFLNQVFWVIYGFATGQDGFGWFAMGFGGGALLGLWRLRKERV